MVRNVKVVTGASYGDEGKGLMTAFFCGQQGAGKCLDICHNGGAQRGHTVVSGNVWHIFHHLGAGTFQGADTYLTKDFILNPMIFAEEVSCMGGLPENVRLCRHPQCSWSTPYDMMANQIIESSRGEARHGSCGAGIWETILRYEKMSAPGADEFAGLSTGAMLDFLGDVREYFKGRFREAGVGNIPEKWKEIFYSKAVAEHFLEDLIFLKNSFAPAEENVSEGYDRLVFEGGQGLLLSEKMAAEYGSDSHTTPSLTGCENPVKFLESIGYSGDIEVCYVTRTYLTRHGAGPFPGECPGEEIGRGITDLTNVPNAHQGTLRYGRIDIAALGRRISADFAGYRKFPGAVKSAAVTHLNETGGSLVLTGGMGQPSGIRADKLYMSWSEDISKIKCFGHGI